MNVLLAFLIFAGCVFGMAIGLIVARKTLKRGCTIDPDACACRREGKDPSQCGDS